MVLLRITLLSCFLFFSSLQHALASHEAEETSLSPRIRTNLNVGWSYLESQLDDVQDLPEASASSWSKVDLPYSWNQWDATDLVPGYRRDVSWYVKTLDYEVETSRRYFLYFEGANLITDVFVNGKKAGQHVGGYVGFRMEITALLSTEGVNQIQVRVDNSHNLELIPSNKADFYIYGGITRDVWLEDVPATMLTNVNISIPEVSAARAITEVQFSLSQASAKYRAEILIFPAGESEPVLTSKITINRKKTPEIITLDPLILEDPKLWAPTLGADDYISKPFSPEELRLKVKNILDSRQKLRQQFVRVIHLEPKEMILEDQDEVFLSKLTSIVEDHLGNPGFGVNELSLELGVSRPVLFKKIKSLTEQTPKKFINSFRLKRAAQLLTSSDLGVAEVAYSVGFRDPKYFSRLFRDTFGEVPGRYVK